MGEGRSDTAEVTEKLSSNDLHQVSPWSKRGTPGPHDEKAWTRGNVAAGIGPDGHPVTLVGGWDANWQSGGKVLPPIVSRSQDGGETWKLHEDGFPESWPKEARGSLHSPHGYLIPFGDIEIDTDGALVAGLYSHNKGATFIYRSRDKGRTWHRDPAPMDAGGFIYEPALIHLGRGRWLCGARSNGLKLYASDDDAKTWTLRKQLLSGLQYPAHLLRLPDNSLLLCYGNRDFPKGVDARFSADEGASWSEPYRLLDYQGDGGYPSSIALPDGRVLTAYYAKNIEGHAGYHMGVVIWDPVATRGQ